MMHYLRKKSTVILSCITVLSMMLSAAVVHASTYLDIEDEMVYVLLSRLEAEGVIRSALLNTRPISRRAAFRLLHEAEANTRTSSQFVKSLVESFKDRLGPEPSETQLRAVDTLYASYIHTNADVLTLTYLRTAREKEQAFNVNNNGDLYKKGSNARVGFTSRLEDWGPLSLSFNPEFRHPDTPYTRELVALKAYAVFSLGFDLVVGKDSQWWGPGYNGAILLSNNAEPFTMVKLTSPEPVTLPWIFKYLGPFQYTGFLTKLEKERTDFPEPYLWGLRFDLKPHPMIELGLQRTAILGGRGRPLNSDTWKDSLFGTNEHSTTTPDTSDQRGGFDLKLTLPFKLQPLQVYWERNGEDGRQRFGGWPYKFADLVGVYLPRILTFERIGLRAEYAVNHIQGWSDVWYTHSLYTAGYTYDKIIIGHHMGTNSRDLFGEFAYLIPEKNARVSLSYDLKKHNVGRPVSEVASEAELTAETSLTEQTAIKASYGVGRISNPGNQQGKAMPTTALGLEMRYRF